MKMVEVLKEEMKNSLKEIKKRQAKNLEEINKSLKEYQESQEKTNR